LEVACPAFLDVDFLLAQFGPTRTAALAGYRRDAGDCRPFRSALHDGEPCRTTLRGHSAGM